MASFLGFDPEPHPKAPDMLVAPAAVARAAALGPAIRTVVPDPNEPTEPERIVVANINLERVRLRAAMEAIMRYHGYTDARLLIDQDLNTASRDFQRAGGSTEGWVL